MTTMRYTMLVSLAALWLHVCLCESAGAWWPIAHYEIAKRAGHPDIAPYAQLPDYEDSWDPIVWTGPPELFEIADISRPFCWSHAAQDAGETAVGLVPLKPTYPDDGRYPEPVMWYLIHNKLKDLSPEQQAEMERTVKGFVAHNAADRVVHYSFFGGADAGDGLSEGKNKWLIGHSHKEKWSDYWVYIRENWANDWEAAFDDDAEGKLKLVPEYANGVPVASPTNPMARVMQLGQKASRKNRRFTEADKDYYVLSPQSISKIKSRIQNTINDSVTDEKVRSEYTKADFLSLEAEAAAQGWVTDDLFLDVADPAQRGKYLLAIDNVAAWLQALEQ